MSSPAHLKARAILAQGIFDRLKSFRHFEKRITALPTAQERGAVFEVFVEAYFATLAVEKAKQVWPGARVPSSLRKRLALTLGDNGVDGVFETPLGAYHAYQAKFRTGRPSLTWDELSTFIGLADRVDQRVLITNCNRFSDVVKQRTGFYAITGNDLDKLTPQDFATIRAWLQGARIERTPKHPLPHQNEALGNILPALREHDRATALMACGTGKTLVALWAAENVVQVFNLHLPTSQAGKPAPRILVLVPSLALLRQILHEWSREASWPSFAHLCVCSDPTVKPGSDELSLRATDLDFPVTTDPRQVRDFLAAKFDGVKLVFATYQSAHVVAAGMRKRDAFDLAIFDEAHKTAGREGVHFSFALSDKNLAIRKRLFLTATPRPFDIRRRDKEGDARLVYSMDAPEVYGPVAHQLSFAEAARRGIICDYKVVISVVTSGMVNDHLLRYGEVIVKGDTVKARHVASQLALQAAVGQHGVGKIFTFHRSVASAAAFTGDGSEGIVNHLPGFDAFHVNGAMPTSERENIMTEFRAASRAVISNARCLTEGVDVPAVDMVAFLTPKRSRVDIVQATGRAMRKAPGKTTGYVLVPLFVEQAKSETIEEALARTEFDEIWNVLQAMQEQDETLAEIIRQMREERGRTKGCDDSRFRERVELLGPQISLETLRDSITTACVEVLGDNWEERFGELQAFKEQHGHCNVPSSYPKNQTFATWVSLQRSRCATLSGERRKRLEAVGFIWDAQEESWKQGVAALMAYKRVHGHCLVPQTCPENPKLGRWVHRLRRNRDDLPKDRIRQLEALGFDLKPQRQLSKGGPTTWEEMFAALTDFYSSHGHCRIPSKWAENPRLAKWVSVQRGLRNKLSENRVRNLEKIGFEWNVLDVQWEDQLSALAHYKALHGNCDVPAEYSENPTLAHWCGNQRAFWKRNKVSAERVRRLDELGFSFEPTASSWDKMFAALVEFKRLHGHFRVSRRDASYANLSNWIVRLRSKRDKLPPAQASRLAGIGFDWCPQQTAWDEKFNELEQYKAVHGDCNVPQNWSKNLALGVWCSSQRQHRKRNKLTEDRIRRLDEIGFRWEPQKDAR